MDWNLFWSAFGAIGTTLGSLITACAVVIAVKQYRQPLKKIIEVSITSAIGLDDVGNTKTFHNISVKNKGIRTVKINSINLQGLGTKKLWINNAQYESNAKVELPVTVEPEECKDFLFEVENFTRGIRQAIKDNMIKENQRLIVFVTDSLGENYYCKAKMKIKDLI